jgi:predicted CXXCH cytochrome family protein
VALNSYGGNPSSGDKMGDVAPGRVVGAGGDLSADHPISFDYDDAQALDNGLYPSSTTVPEAGSKTIAQALLVNGMLECSSCHDVHEEKGESGTAPYALIVDNSGSDLCLTCHRK